MNAKSVIGIDPSLVNSAVCFRDKEGQIKSVSIKPKTKNKFERLNFIIEEIHLWVDTIELLTKQRPLAVIEHYPMNIRTLQTRALLQLAELGGIIRYQLWESKCPVLEVAPSTLKQFITGKGNANKTAMIHCIENLYHHSVGKDNNCADACGLMVIGESYIKVLQGQFLRSAAKMEYLKKCNYHNRLG